MKFYLKKKKAGSKYCRPHEIFAWASPSIIESQISELFAVTQVFLTFICFYFLMPIHETPAFGIVGLNIELEVLSVVI